MTPAATTPTPESVVYLRLAEVKPAPDNVRVDVGDVTELAASITSAGILEPLVVTAAPAGDAAGGYRVVVGHRRLAAAKLAGLPVVPAIIRTLTDQQRLEAMLVENLQRQDLTPLEEAEAYRRLVELGIGQVELAKRIGRSQAHVSKRLSLLKLPDVARTAIAAGSLDLASALELVPFAGAPAVIGGALERLVQDSKRGGFYRAPAGQVAGQVKQELEEAQARKTALEGLAAAKVSIVKTDDYGRPVGGARVTQLGKGWGQIPMAPAAHKKHGCHAAYVDGRGVVHYVCTKPAEHVKDPAKAIAKAAREIAGVKTTAGGKLAKAASVKAAETRERNKTLRVAEPIRRKLAAQLLKPSKVRREAVDFALRQLIQTTLDRQPDVARLAAELLGVKAKDRDGAPSFRTFTSPAQVDQLAYALALAAGEAPFAQLAARGYFPEDLSSHAARYFAHLKSANYKATPVELAQIKPSGWRPAFDGAGK